ncbi:MAG: Spi family protease inhibitor, partial [Muribaculaceae bacterium]|nr:Spi family protease inhibitor [Muribaculaceae bacterium]
MRKDISVIWSILLVTALMFCGLTAAAETVSQKQAREYAHRFFNIHYGETVAPVDLVYNGKRLTTQRLFTPFYVYNEPRGGYVIISAENKVFPVLGYSLTEHFNPNEISEVEQALLRNYALDIEEVRYNSEVPEQAIE